MQYKIYEDFYPTVEKKINRIAKKAAKYNNPFTFQIVDKVVEEVEDEETGYKNYYPFFIVEVDGKAQVGDYICVAVLEMHKTGNIIRKIDGHFDTDIPERFLHSENMCEHCSTKRNRKQLYIVYNAGTGEFKQVGSDCLALYTGGLNPNWVASYYDCLTELEECDGGYVDCGGTPLYPVEDILAYADEIITKTGYFNSESDLPTKMLVSTMFTPYTSFRDNVWELNDTLHNYKVYDVVFHESDFFKEETKKRVEGMIEYYKSLKPDSEYLHNVQVLLNEGFAKMSHFGFLCYLPEGYNRYLREEKAKAEQRNTELKSEYFGEVGKRYKSQNVSVAKMLTGWENQYGMTYLYQLILESGNILIWKSSSWHSKDELDTVRRIDFTVKEHNEYKDTKQTTITRCKFVA
jgi:hypothetical protein